jgi:hypothetical protein
MHESAVYFNPWLAPAVLNIGDDLPCGMDADSQLRLRQVVHRPVGDQLVCEVSGCILHRVIFLFLFPARGGYFLIQMNPIIAYPKNKQVSLAYHPYHNAVFLYSDSMNMLAAIKRISTIQ